MVSYRGGSIFSVKCSPCGLWYAVRPMAVTHAAAAARKLRSLRRPFSTSRNNLVLSVRTPSLHRTCARFSVDFENQRPFAFVCFMMRYVFIILCVLASYEKVFAQFVTILLTCLSGNYWRRRIKVWSSADANIQRGWSRSEWMKWMNRPINKCVFQTVLFLSAMSGCFRLLSPVSTKEIMFYLAFVCLSVSNFM